MTDQQLCPWQANLIQVLLLFCFHISHCLLLISSELALYRHHSCQYHYYQWLCIALLLHDVITAITVASVADASRTFVAVVHLIIMTGNKFQMMARLSIYPFPI